MLNYDDWKYAERNFKGTYLLHKRTRGFVFVDFISGDGNYICCTVTHCSNYQKAKIPLDALELGTPLLGFVQLEPNLMYYFSRAAKRNDWRQGLRPNNVEIKIYNDMYCGLRVPPDIHMNNSFMKAAKNTVTNDFPALQEATQTMLENKASINLVFDRSWAFTRQGAFIHVLYKGHKVGVLSPQGEVQFDSKSYWVKRIYEAHFNA